MSSVPLAALAEGVAWAGVLAGAWLLLSTLAYLALEWRDARRRAQQRAAHRLVLQRWHAVQAGEQQAHANQQRHEQACAAWRAELAAAGETVAEEAEASEGGTT